MTDNLTPDFRKAVNEFLIQFTAPAIKPENVFYGNQNNLSLPLEDDFIIYSYTGSQRHGEGCEEWTKADGEDVLLLSNTIEVMVQVDFYATTKNGQDGMNAMLRAHSIETVSRSTVGVDFFTARGLSLLYSDDPKDTTIVGDSEMYVRRSTLTLHISMQSKIKTPVGFFNELNLDLRNVDVSYPPKDEK